MSADQFGVIWDVGARVLQSFSDGSHVLTVFLYEISENYGDTSFFFFAIDAVVHSGQSCAILCTPLGYGIGPGTRLHFAKSIGLGESGCGPIGNAVYGAEIRMGVISMSCDG